MKLFELIFFAIGICASSRIILNYLSSRLVGFVVVDEIYNMYLNSLTKNHFDFAVRKEKIDKGWIYLTAKKAFEMGISKLSDSSNRMNLRYIKEYIEDQDQPISGKMLILRLLMKALPKQKNSQIQKEMIEVISDSIRNFPTQKMDELIDGLGNTPQFISPEDFVIRLSNIFAAWVASIAMFMFANRDLIKYQTSEVLLLIIFLLILSCAPLVSLFRMSIQVLRYSIAVGAIILFAFGSFANSTHRQSEVKRIDLNTYGFGSINFQYLYPTWLTIDDISECTENNKVSLTITNGILPVIKFDYSANMITVRDTNCSVITPQTNSELSQGETFEFHVLVVNQEVLKLGSVVLIPAILSSNNSFTELDHDNIEIHLEPPLWRYLREWYKYFIPVFVGAFIKEIIGLLKGN